MFIERISFNFKFKDIFFYEFKDRAGGTTHDELKLTQKTFIVAEGRVS